MLGKRIRKNVLKSRISFSAIFPRICKNVLHMLGIFNIKYASYFTPAEEIFLIMDKEITSTFYLKIHIKKHRI